MNPYFNDTRYHVERAVESASKGVRAEIEPVEARVRELAGWEAEPEPSRIDRLAADLRAWAERTARATIVEARARLQSYRESRA